MAQSNGFSQQIQFMESNEGSLVHFLDTFDHLFAQILWHRLWQSGRHDARSLALEAVFSSRIS